MDENEDQVPLDLDASCQFREQVLAYTRYWLGLELVTTKPAAAPSTSRFSWLSLGSGGDASASEDREWTYAFLAGLGYKRQREPTCPNLPCGTFKEFGKLVQRDFSKGLCGIRSPSLCGPPSSPPPPLAVLGYLFFCSYSVAGAVFRERFWQELKDYLDHSEIKQRERLTGQFSDSFESYVAIRSYTSAVPVYCFITQYAFHGANPNPSLGQNTLIFPCVESPSAQRSQSGSWKLLR